MYTSTIPHKRSRDPRVQIDEKEEIEGVVYDVIDEDSDANSNTEGDEQTPEEVEGEQRPYNL